MICQLTCQTVCHEFFLPQILSLLIHFISSCVVYFHFSSGIGRSSSDRVFNFLHDKGNSTSQFLKLLFSPLNSLNHFSMRIDIPNSFPESLRISNNFFWLLDMHRINNLRKCISPVGLTSHNEIIKVFLSPFGKAFGNKSLSFIRHGLCEF